MVLVSLSSKEGPEEGVPANWLVMEPQDGLGPDAGSSSVGRTANWFQLLL